jgi:hypothetical protein
MRNPKGDLTLNDDMSKEPIKTFKILLPNQNQ